MAKKRKAGFKKKRRVKPPRTWVWVALFGLTGSLLFSLVWLSDQQPGSPLSDPPPPVVVDPVPVEELAAEAEAFLTTVPVRSTLVKREMQAVPVRYTVDGKPPSAGMVQKFRSRLKSLSSKLSVKLTADDLLIVSEGDVPQILIFFVPALRPALTRPRVAIIVDDLGRNLAAAKTLIALEQPVTFSILPGEPHSRKVAQMAHDAKREVLLHAPMEPQGYPEVNPGSNALFVRNTETEIKEKLGRLLEEIPEAVGTNNHMGSRFTENRRGMAVVMALLRERGLFFIDSLTTGRSVGRETADELGVAVLQRDVFLDNTADVEKIALQLRQLADQALRDGQAVGICHPYPETLLALQRELPRLAEEGIRFVPVSRLLKKPVRGG